MINIYLIKEDLSALLGLVYEGLQELEGTKLHWISAEDVLKQFKSSQQKCYFIFSYFKGDCFNYLRSLNMTIFGPQLILDCLRNDEQLPRCPDPVFSTAMSGIVISFTGINKSVRDELKDYVIMMGGTVSGDLTEGVNVVVAGSIGSKKYTVAGERGLKIMCPSWITRLWQYSGERDPVEPWDTEIVKECRLPILHQLCVTVTGLSAQERSQLRTLIESNGATYMPDLQAGVCTHIIAAESRGQKCLYAAKWKIPVVSTSWLLDSIERGYYQDEAGYRLDPANSTTEHSTPKDGANRRPPSMCSDISNITVTKVDETKLGMDDDDFDVDSLNDISDFDQNQPTVTETVQSQPTITKNASPQQTLIENAQDHPTATENVDNHQTVTEDVQWDSLGSYFSEAIHSVFHRTSFVFHGSVSSADRDRASTIIAANGGTVALSVTNNVMLIVADTLTEKPSTSYSSVTIVTCFYVHRCVTEGQLLSPDADLLYEPVIVTASMESAMKHCVMSFSGYEPEERTVLKNVCRAMGATIQDSMARRAMPQRHIVATTHLIIATVDRQKYPSSISWRIPAVTRHWIEACVRAQRLVATEAHLLQPGNDDLHNGTTTSVNTDGNLNETCLSINNKHLQIKNVTKTPLNRGNQSFGDLDTPIRPMRTSGTNAIDMDNLKAILKTPDHCETRHGRGNVAITTPDIERALLARLAIMSEEAPPKFPDFSFTDNQSTVQLSPLNAVVIYLSKSVGNVSQMSIIDKIEQLGGSRTWVYEPKVVTHVIGCNSSVSDRNREELERAIIDGKMVVTADWLNQCSKEYRRVDEEIYLVNTNMKEEIETRKRKISDEVKEETMEIVNVIETRPGIRQRVNEPLSWSYDEKEGQMEGDDTQLETEEADGGEGGEERDKEGYKRVIMFSSLEQEDRQRYNVVVEQLGGQIVTEENISGITHLVCCTPGRGEKFLAAVAAGKWIVHKSYLDEVARVGRWVDETEFEFGGPRTAEFIRSEGDGKSSANEMNLASAANRWREIGGGAFKEWRVGIIDSAERIEKLGNIIESGGGKLVPMCPLPTTAQVTHLLVNKKKCADVNGLDQFPCYKIELIQYFLTARSQSETKKYTKKLIITPEELSALAGSGGSRVTRSSRS